MSTVSPSAAPNSGAANWFSGFRGVLAGEADAWLFVLRATLSLFITGWLAMRLQLPQAGTAMLTTVIVMHRQSGMVLAKSFYRVLGTLIGAVAALAVVAAFPQQREPFLLVMALWIGACAAGATLHRNFKSYAFVLAGYTAAIIALPVITTHPGNVFDSAVARITEVMLGLVVSAVISDTVLPVRLRDNLRNAVRNQYANFLEFVREALLGQLPRERMEQQHLRMVRDAVALEDLRSAVIFEDPEARARSLHLLQFNQGFMAASTSFQSLHHLINRLMRQEAPVAAQALLVLYRPLGVALQSSPQELPADALAARIRQVRLELPARGKALHAEIKDAAQAEDFEVGTGLLRRFSQELESYIRARGQLLQRVAPSKGVERVRFVRGNDRAGAMLAFVRTTTTMLLLGAFWAATGWQMGANVMLLATIFSGLFATAPNAARVTSKVLFGYIAGLAAGYVCAFEVLTRMDGYALLVASVLPFFIIGPYLTTRPKLALFGLGYTMALVNILTITNPMTFDPQRYFNDALSQIVGLGAAGVGFALLPPAVGSRWLRQRQMAALRALVRLAAQAPLPGLRHHFESMSSDLVHQVVAHTVPGSDDSRSLLAWALAVNETGRALIHLRHDVARRPLSAALHRDVDDAVNALAAFFGQPSREAWQGADIALRRASDAARADTEAPEIARQVLYHLRLVRLAMVDDHSVMAAYIVSADAPKEGVINAD
ncbi:FUSC family protein [Stenotrophomonas sp. Iso1]|uniref:FUSC family protein n=1 Tax=Stenotrophomonas sp. Iso1 TaxID=2977283 RepID=UPI0022B7A178|nr:FUSC family protein [Stenotrophomonas sp. Iso1]